MEMNPSNENSLEVLSSPPNKKTKVSPTVEEEKGSSGPRDQLNLSPLATKEAKEQSATKKAEKSPAVEDTSAPEYHSPPPTKKAKRDTSGPAPSAEGDASGSKKRKVKRKTASGGSSWNGPWGLRKQMHVRIIKFNGAKRVQIVRSIEKNGKLLTWKGIAMSKQIWEKLMKNADRISRALEN